MTTFTKILLSGSTNGRNIKVVATASAGTLLHTAVSGTTDLDEIYIFAVNTDTVTRSLTIEFGGTTSPDDLIEIDLEAAKGAYLVIPGWLLQNGLVVRAFGSAANVIEINGYVNRIEA
jgi:hypothetical protein